MRLHGAFKHFIDFGGAQSVSWPLTGCRYRTG